MCLRSVGHFSSSSPTPASEKHSLSLMCIPAITFEAAAVTSKLTDERAVVALESVTSIYTIWAATSLSMLSSRMSDASLRSWQKLLEHCIIGAGASCSLREYLIPHFVIVESKRISGSLLIQDIRDCRHLQVQSQAPCVRAEPSSHLATAFLHDASSSPNSQQTRRRPHACLHGTRHQRPSSSRREADRAAPWSAPGTIQLASTLPEP